MIDITEPVGFILNPEHKKQWYYDPNLSDWENMKKICNLFKNTISILNSQSNKKRQQELSFNE